MTSEQHDTTKEHGPRGGESQRFIAMHNARTGRRYAKAVGLMLLAVLAGVVIGVACSVLYFNKRMHRPPPKGEAIAKSIVNRIDSLVKLSPDEERRLTVIADARMKEVDAIRRNSFGEMRKVFDTMSGEIAEVIGPERAKVWNEYRDKRWGDKRGRDHKRRDDDPK